MKPGDQVLLVHDLGGPPDPVTVVELLDTARALVRFPRSGATLIVPRTLLLTDSVAIPHRHRADDHATAIAAADSQARRLRATQLAVLGALVAAGDRGLTDHEHEPLNGLKQDSAGKRRGELLELGLVADSHRTRPTPRGRRAKVWVVTPAGRLVFQAAARRQPTPGDAA